MAPKFSGGGFANEVVNANNREELVKVFAKYRVVPKKNPMAGSDVAKSDYVLERRGDRKPGGRRHAVGPQTRISLIEELGIESDTKCKKIRDKIRSHPKWRSNA